MDKKDEDRLRTNRVFLVKSIKHIDDVVDHLNGQGIVNASYMDRTKNLTRDAKVRELLDFLPCKKLGFKAFIVALKESDHLDIAEKLAPESKENKEGESTPQPSPSKASNELPDPYVNENLVIKPATKMYGPSDDIYSMKKKPRGLVLIFNNDEFTGTTPVLSKREGSTIDSKALEDLFVGLHFKHQVKNNQSASDMKKHIKYHAKEEFHKDFECLVVAVLSHGVEGSVYGADGQLVNIKDEIIDPFLKCEALKGKPKLFFIQACRDKMNPDETSSTDSTPIEPPNYADVLIVKSAVSGTKAYRDVNHGSFFIQQLVKVFAALAHEKHISELLTKVTALVNDFKAPDGVALLIAQETFLKKSLYFNPGLP